MTAMNLMNGWVHDINPSIVELFCETHAMRVKGNVSVGLTRSGHNLFYYGNGRSAPGRIIEELTQIAGRSSGRDWVSSVTHVII
jgi:hypothetical protein